MDEPDQNPAPAPKQSRISHDSIFFNSVFPLLIILFTLVLAGLILFALGILTGLIKY